MDPTTLMSEEDVLDGHTAQIILTLSDQYMHIHVQHTCKYKLSNELL